MYNNTVKDLMKTRPCAINQDTTISKAACLMKEVNCGALPVGEENNVVGILTDRDIVLRFVAAGLDTNSTSVKEIMTKKIYTCHENDPLQDATKKMIQHRIGRLAVLDQDNKLTGILSFGSIMRHTPDKALIADLAQHVSTTYRL